MTVIPETMRNPDWFRKVAQVLNGLQREPMVDDITLAESVVRKTYNETVSVAAKGKNLNKFGLNSAVGTTFETVSQFQGTVANETFVTTNLIDSIVSSSASDTSQTITVEGHTIDGSGNLTFVTQNAALNGQTEVTLATPLARATRAFVKSSGTFGVTPTALAGTVYIYDNTGGITAGVPNTAAATKLLIAAGETRTEKCATAISQNDYYFISEWGGAIQDPNGATANTVTLQLQIRDVANGGAWMPIGRDVYLIPGQNGRSLSYRPFLIIPKNHDVRMVAKTDTGSAAVSAEINGYLAAIQ